MRSVVSPDAQQVDQEVAGELGGQHLRDDVQVRNQSRLQDDRDVRGVEQLDWVGRGLSTVASRLDGKVDAEALEYDLAKTARRVHRTVAYLEVDDDGKDEHGGEEVHQVGQVLAVEGFAQRSHLIVTSGQEMEEGNDATFELSATASVDRCWTERFPDDCLADVGGNEQRNARAETVALLEQLVE